MNIGKRLRQERQRRHLSQEALAEILGISTQSISRWERGTVVPQAHYRLQLSRFFDIPPHVLFPEQEEHVEERETFWSVPYPRNPYFVGREDVFQQLYTLLHTTDTTAIRQPQAITGLAGSGKTQTVLEYVYRFRNAYDAVFWIQAETYESLLFHVVSLAPILQLPVRHDQSDVRMLEAFKHWLHAHQHWLLILDNVEDLSLLTHVDIPGTDGHIVFTTRSQFTGIAANQYDLAALSADEGTLFLLRRSKKIRLDQSLEQSPETLVYTARKIYDALVGLPLALDQAGAYIDETGCELADFLKRYEQQRRHLLDRRGIMGNTHPDSFLTTLVLAYEQLQQINPLATQVLLLCAFFYPDEIPEELIRAGTAYFGDDTATPGPVDAYYLDQAIVALRSLSLIFRCSRDNLFCVHRLVQVVFQENMEAPVEREWMVRAIRALNMVFPEESQYPWPMYDWYLSHARVCDQFIQRADIRIGEAVDLLRKTGSYLLKRGHFNEAHHFLTRALSLQQTLYGSDSPGFAVILQLLISLYSLQDNTGQVS